MSNNITLLLALLLSVNFISNAQSVIENVDFDTYNSATDNDFENNFSHSLPTFYQINNNGITGGCVIPPDSNNWGNDNARYCSKYKGVRGSTYTTSICFKYDSLLRTTGGFERTTAIWMVPGTDFNHYLIADIMHNKTIQVVSYAWVNPTSPNFNFMDNYWYQFILQTLFIGGGSNDQINLSASIYNLGMSGQDPPIPMGTVSGMIHDSVLFADTAIEVSITGATQGGAAYLDNFSYNGEKSADSCNRATGTKEIISDDAITYNITNNILSVTMKGDFENAGIEIINVTGEKLLADNLKSNSRFNLSEFENGIYFLSITTERKHFTEKFILMK